MVDKLQPKITKWPTGEGYIYNLLTEALEHKPGLIVKEEGAGRAQEDGDDGTAEEGNRKAAEAGGADRRGDDGVARAPPAASPRESIHRGGWDVRGVSLWATATECVYAAETAWLSTGTRRRATCSS